MASRGGELIWIDSNLITPLWICRPGVQAGAMTETETLIAEVRQLRADVARLHAAHTPVHIRSSTPRPPSSVVLS
jgi:hypothetical protein